MAYNDKGEVIFDEKEQAEVDRIVKDRLGRVKPPDDYDELKALASDLKDFGYEGSPKDVRARIAEQKTAAQKARERREAEERAEQRGTSPETELEIKRLAEKQAQLEAEQQVRSQKEEDARRQEQQQKEAEATWKQQVKEFTEAYPDIDVEKLADDADFVDYAEGKYGKKTLKELYAGYQKLVGKAETDGFVKARDKERRSTGGGSTKAGDTHGLTADQIATVDEWNRKYPSDKMTYKQFKDRL